MTTAVHPETLFGAGRAARLLGISNQGVDYLARSGKLPFVVIDGRRYFDRADLERYNETRRSAR